MSKFDKKVAEYRRGEDWKSNFKHINFDNISSSVKAIITKDQQTRLLDRFGNRKGTSGYREPLSWDEQAFRIAVLIDTQFDALLKEREE